MTFRSNKKENKNWKIFRKLNLPAQWILFSSAIMHHYYYCKVQMKHFACETRVWIFVKNVENIGLNGEKKKEIAEVYIFHLQVWRKTMFIMKLPSHLLFPQKWKKTFIQFFIYWIRLEYFCVKWDSVHKTNGTLTNEVYVITGIHSKTHLILYYRHLNSHTS